MSHGRYIIFQMAEVGSVQEGRLSHSDAGQRAPVVPVVIRNTYEVMTRSSLLFRPGTVQVCALPPIDVTKWKVEDLDRHVADVRTLFQHTLDDWPAAGRG